LELFSCGIFLAASIHSDNLVSLLREVFGFSAFRANQEDVCRAALAGRDLLLVMPTGSGKSLCYQLPALARGGTALVISPLIALMEDQAAKLSSLGLRVARIHSGLDRAAARQACSEYLAGNLQFLFIAPERLRVPGFPEMLAKRPLALIAIDEAHCISQWGHDFRPDYRMLGRWLPMLREGREQGNQGTREQGCPPVLALTATATPTVQADIVAQLGMANPAKFIHGFRRDNLAIEVVEVPMPMRAGIVTRLLADAKRRPAIVYAQSRKQSEALAEELKHAVRAATYHAGLDAETRERVQTAFQACELEVVVATIAFGMGIDKADIRTVIHAGLPATLEGYYQEIGRAGRDGKPSRTILMHSYADQRTHDFLLSRDYPPSDHLTAVFRALATEPRPIEDLRAAAGLAPEEFDKALEKLLIHGGAVTDFSRSTAALGRPDWNKTYSVQAQYRREQLEKVLRYVDAQDCRMAALVRHFGDEEDAAQECGKCDACDPAGALLRLFRRANPRERQWVQQIVDALRPVAYKTPKGLRSELPWAEALDRNDFDGLLDGMQRAGLIQIEHAELDKLGETIFFRKISLTEAGFELRPSSAIELLLDDGLAEDFAARTQPPVKKRAAKPSTAPASGPRTSESQPSRPPQLSASGAALAQRLREWRAEEARRTRVPAFMILHDRTLEAIAHACPATPNALLQVAGVGPTKADRFGPAILALCRDSSTLR